MAKNPRLPLTKGYPLSILPALLIRHLRPLRRPHLEIQRYSLEKLCDERSKKGLGKLPEGAIPPTLFADDLSCFRTNRQALPSHSISNKVISVVGDRFNRDKL